MMFVRSIGENVAPESGERSGDDDDVSGSGESIDSDPSKSPTPLVPEVTDPEGTGENSSENDSNREVDASEGGLSGGSYAGIAVAAAAVVGTMLLYL